MPETNGSPLGRLAEAIRKQLHEHEDTMHEHDIRLTKLETKDDTKTKYGNLFWKILAVLISIGALVVAIIALT